MVTGGGSGGAARGGGARTGVLMRVARQRAADGLPGGWDDPAVRDRLIRLWCEEQVRGWTNQRVRARIASGLAPGPESSIGKGHGTDLNQPLQPPPPALPALSATPWPAP